MVSRPSPPPVGAAPPPPAPPAERTDTQTQALAAEQRRRFAEPQGRASTILSSGTAAGAASQFLGSAART